MNIDDQLYIIRGTGFLIDGTLVVLTKDWGDGFYSVTPYNSKIISQVSLKVNKNCIQKVDNKPIIDYVITIDKVIEGIVVQSSTQTVTAAIRDVDVESVVMDVHSSISPILRME